MRSFDIPNHYRSSVISRVKDGRRHADRRRRDFSPTVLELGAVRLMIARHFGFCFGVENAIEIAYQTLEANPDRRIFLLSEMIHNPHVNRDLLEKGVKFIMTPSGEQIVQWSELTEDDVVIVPAFGTTLEIARILAERKIDPYTWDTTCPFVEKVWNRSNDLGTRGFTVVVHGKPTHEETRATFSHARASAPTVVVRDMNEAVRLAGIIDGSLPLTEFAAAFGSQSSDGFDPRRDLVRLGVVNQTTMLASETQAISDRLRDALLARYGAESLPHHFADTRDTLCYATNENQNATLALADAGADCAIVIGGYNSSNTSHLVELLSKRMTTWFVRDASEIISRDALKHFDLARHERITACGWLPEVADRPVEIAITSGASCPDALVDEVLERIVSFFPEATSLEQGVTEALRAMPSL